jgi:hypothetical protein
MCHVARASESTCRGMEGRNHMSDEILPYARRASPLLRGREMFGVVVRTIGLVITIWALYTMFYITAGLAVALPTSSSPAVHSLFAFCYATLGVALLRGEWVVRFAYGPDKDM